MSKANKRMGKYNSDNDNLFVYDIDTVAKFGSLPYESSFDFGKNGRNHLTDVLEIDDFNYFHYFAENINDFSGTYKI